MDVGGSLHQRDPSLALLYDTLGEPTATSVESFQEVRSVHRKVFYSSFVADAGTCMQFGETCTAGDLVTSGACVTWEKESGPWRLLCGTQFVEDDLSTRGTLSTCLRTAPSSFVVGRGAPRRASHFAGNDRVACVAPEFRFQQEAREAHRGHLQLHQNPRNLSVFDWHTGAVWREGTTNGDGMSAWCWSRSATSRLVMASATRLYTDLVWFQREWEVPTCSVSLAGVDFPDVRKARGSRGARVAQLASVVGFFF